ncbi:hypothetical protein [Streptomyces sp. NPDC005732]|uniref:hypothetical protein n=1 Tax=Streptomyces sp. NPDC005732 TaxID=3157057 RepID=UPI0033C57A46
MRSNPDRCGASGRLSDTDVMRLQNLAFTDSIMSWEDQALTCQLPEGHEVQSHVQHLVGQDFGGEWVAWWASWLDKDGLRDEAAMFTAPECNEFSEEEPEKKFVCPLLRGHTTDDDQRHIFM